MDNGQTSLDPLDPSPTLTRGRASNPPLHTPESCVACRGQGDKAPRDPRRCIRSDDGGDLAQPVMADANRPYRQTAPVGVRQPDASRAELSVALAPPLMRQSVQDDVSRERVAIG